MARSVHPVPTARSADLVTTATTTALLVYDQLTHHIHHLNATTTAVWHACNGERMVDDIATVTGTTEEIVRVALTQLDNASLLAGPLDPAVLHNGQTRRRFLKRAAVAGAAAVPALVSVTAPAAAETASCTSIGGPCAVDTPETCCSSACRFNQVQSVCTALEVDVTTTSVSTQVGTSVGGMCEVTITLLNGPTGTEVGVRVVVSNGGVATPVLSAPDHTAASLGLLPGQSLVSGTAEIQTSSHGTGVFVPITIDPTICSAP
jgi:hypothetical protein